MKFGRPVEVADVQLENTRASEVAELREKIESIPIKIPGPRNHSGTKAAGSRDADISR